MARPTEFERELISLIPHIRAFARSLCRSAVEADDLAQDALSKALANRHRFTMGTNMKAWAFMILRNQFYSDKRRSWRAVALDPDVAERTLVAHVNPDRNLELDELRRALAQLPPEQREALVLVAAGGLAYEDAAKICGVAVGTIKSRVSRARDGLALVYAEDDFDWDGAAPDLAMASIMSLAIAAAAVNISSSH